MASDNINGLICYGDFFLESLTTLIAVMMKECVRIDSFSSHFALLHSFVHVKKYVLGNMNTICYL